jgi:hypothetical protein
LPGAGRYASEKRRRTLLKPKKKIRISIPEDIPISKELPYAFFPDIREDNNDFGNLSYLGQALLNTDPEKFPFQRAMALYCLLVISILTDGSDGIIDYTPAAKAKEAARILCGMFNFYTNFDSKTQIADEFTEKIPATAVKTLNERFFEPNGGLSSLTYTTRADTFFVHLWERYHARLMMHDVIEFLLKASISFPEAASAEIAFEAIAANIFERPARYGVLRKDHRVGAHRKWLEAAGFPVGDREILITPKGVRERWKEAPDLIVLSYALARHFKWMAYPLAKIHLVTLIHSAKPAPVKKALAFYNFVSTQLAKHGRKQNASIQKWAKPSIEYPTGWVKFPPFTDQQRDFIVRVVKVRLKRDISNSGGEAGLADGLSGGDVGQVRPTWGE